MKQEPAWKDRLPGGKADDKRPSDFDPKALAKGEAHEREHIKEGPLAREIAMDHLAENDKYYDMLDQVEKNAAYRLSAFFRKRAEDLRDPTTRFLHGGQDPEGGMALSKLHRMCHMTQMLTDILHEDDQLPGWVQDHISVAHENLAQVFGYIEPQAAKTGAEKRLKDPKGGLTAAGRAHFKRTEGANLKPGVKGPADTPEKMKRKGSFLSRMFGPGAPGSMQTDSGKPTRRALSAAAWGEPVPKDDAGRARLYAKGQRLLERYKNKKEGSALGQDAAAYAIGVKSAEKAPWDKPNPKKDSKPLTPAQKANAKASARAAGRPYPNLVDNMRAGRKA